MVGAIPSQGVGEIAMLRNCTLESHPASLVSQAYLFATVWGTWYNPAALAEDGQEYRIGQSWRKPVEGFSIYVQIVQIVISIALIVVILAQAKGQGGLGGIFGGEGGVYRTRRGVERTLFNVTVGLAVAFFIVSIISVLVA
jgi:preprotein translocase subunit SecG